MKLQVIIDIDIKIEADKEHVADVITTQLNAFLKSHLRNTEHSVCVVTNSDESLFKPFA